MSYSLTPRHSTAHTSNRWRTAALALLATLATAALMLSTLTGTQSFTARADAAPVTVTGLQANGRTEPLGISGDAPTLSWHATSDARGVTQSAYQVRVATSAEGLASPLWDSGKVASAEQLDIAYGGPALESSTRYFWQVKIWDGTDAESSWSESSWFETGLNTTDEWTADWIGKSAGGEVDKWTNYTADVKFSIENLAFGLFFRAASTSNAYMWQLTVADGTPRLKIHKRVNGNYSVVENKDISGTISRAALLSGQHTLTVVTDGTSIVTKLDGTQIDSRTDSAHTKGFIGFRSSHATEGDEKSTVYGATVTAKSGEVLLDTDLQDGNPFGGAGTYSAGKLVFSGDGEALWTSPDANRPLLRKEFSTAQGKTVASARIHASAHGIYELSLNGEKVGDQELAPGYTEYRKRIQYQTYDVTSQLASGANAFGAALADGWWAGKVGMWGPGIYGNSLALVAQLRITYTDGTSEVIETDSSWKSHFGPFAFTDNIDGETYDARDEQIGWDQPGFDDGDWNAVAVQTSDSAKLVAQPDEPVRVTEELATVERTEPTPGAYIYDMGQNMVGVARMTLTGQAGSTVTIRWGEELNPDGTLYTANLRAAKVTDHYTFASTGTVEYTPTFTQHGFRYIEITGAGTAPTAEQVTGVVWGSDLPNTGTLETSNGMLNQLQSNISWGQRGNFLSIPTDTPARDERLGWTGDINVFSPTASYLTDTRAFLAKWLIDLRDTQRENGSFPGIAPNTQELGGGTGWEDAMVTVTYAVYKAYGDKSIIRDNYDAMVRFMDYVKASAGSDLIDSDRNVYGDWLNLDDNTPAGILGTAYYAENSRMMAEMAEAIGESGDSAAYSSQSSAVRAAFANQFVADDGTVSSNSQTAYAMTLGMNLVPEELREKVGKKFVAKLATSGNHLTTGFLGTPWLLPALTSIDRSDIAYEMLLHEDYPSWGYEIANGATTMWERWNSIMPDGSFGDVGMNSFNHYAYGAVGDWMYRNIGGISPDSAGYKSFTIAPNPGGNVTTGHGTYQSAYGQISSNWATTDSGIDLAVEIPVNTTATVVLPAANAYAVTEGGTPLSQVDGVSDPTFSDGKVSLTVGSGSYAFSVTRGQGLMGDVITKIADVSDAVIAYADAGDLDEDAANALLDGLVAATASVEEALSADLAGDATGTATKLGEGLAVIDELREWLGESSVSGPVRADLDKQLRSLRATFGRAIAEIIGVTVTIPPVASSTRGGQKVSGTVDIVNSGSTVLSDVNATVSIDGWNSDSIDVAVDAIAAGESAQLPFTVKVPKHQAPGAYDASVTVSFDTEFGTVTVKDATSWATVQSGVEITGVTSAHPVADSEEVASVVATVHNTGDAAVTGQVAIGVPEGWVTPVRSATATIAAGATAEITVPVFVGQEAVSGDHPVTARFVSGGTELARAPGSLTVALAAPPTQDAMDYVDFGDAASESAHALQAAPNSGTNTEAGLTRRYAHTSHPGSWYSAEYEVTAGEPFILRNRETFDGARTKRYNIYIDDVLLRQYDLVRVESGIGTKTYQILVDDPAVLANDGTVRIKYEYPLDAGGYFDPSIADSWVLPVSADTLPPEVSATVTSEAPVGDNGWFRGDAEVAVEASDNRDGDPVVEVGQDSGWQAYGDPVQVSGEGEHTVFFRAKDASGNGSGDKSVQIGIDSTAPLTTVKVNRKAGVAESDRATLSFTAEDALSGVASTQYRIDRGEWAVLGDESPVITGYGEHTVEFFSTDVAGNPESLGTTVVDIADVESISAIVAPKVSGTARFGGTLSASKGTWNAKDLVFGYQWLRDGKAIGGATASKYTVAKADVGHRISVRVQASKPGKPAGSAVSASTASVAKATTTASVKLSSSSVKKGKSVKLSITVKSSAGTPTGAVRVYRDGKRVPGAVLSNGRASVKVSLPQSGRHSIKVVYQGSSVFLADASTVKKVKVS